MKLFSTKTKEFLLNALAIILIPVGSILLVEPPYIDGLFVFLVAIYLNMKAKKLSKKEDIKEALEEFEKEHTSGRNRIQDTK